MLFDDCMLFDEYKEFLWPKIDDQFEFEFLSIIKMNLTNNKPF